MRSRFAHAARLATTYAVSAALALSLIPAPALAEAAGGAAAQAGAPAPGGEAPGVAADGSGGASEGQSLSEAPEAAGGAPAALSTQDAGDIASGTVGTCSWAIDADGTLVIAPADGVSGTLEVPTSWSVHANSITSLLVRPGVKGGASLAQAFHSLSRLKSADLSNLDTSDTILMTGLIQDCGELETVRLGNMDTSKVTDMGGMFKRCYKLRELDVSALDTSQVTNMASMFEDCWSLESIDVSHFDTSQVTDMGGMFMGCSALESIDLSSFDTSRVTDFSSMFRWCAALKRLDLSHLDVSQAENLSYLAPSCSLLEELDVSGLALPSGADCSDMFSYSTRNLKTIRTDGSLDLGRAFPEGIPEGVEIIDTSQSDDPAPTDISDATVSAPAQTWTGSALEPAVTVALGGVTLVAGRDYDVAYANNVGPGTATVTVTGRGAYAGTATGSFEISKEEPQRTDISGATVAVEGWTYDGGEHAVSPKVTLGGVTLALGTDYELSGATSARDAGEYEITVTGVGAYEGTATGRYSVARRPVTVRADDKTKTEGEADPALTATVEGTVPGEAVSYALSRDPGEDPGSYAITPAGDEVQGSYQVAFETGMLTVRAAQQPADPDPGDPEPFQGTVLEELRHDVEVAQAAWDAALAGLGGEQAVDVAAAQALRDAAKQTADAAKQTEAAATNDVATSKAALEDANAEKSAAESAKATAEADKATADADAAAKKDAMDGAKADYDSAANAAVAAEGAEAIAQRTAELQAEVTNADAELNNATEALATAGTLLNTAKADYDKAVENKQAADAAVTTAEANVASAQAKVDAAAGDAAKQQAIDAAKADLDAANDALRDAKQRADKAQTDLDAANAAKQAAQDKVDAQTETVRQAAEAAANATSATVDALAGIEYTKGSLGLMQWLSSKGYDTSVAQAMLTGGEYTFHYPNGEDEVFTGDTATYLKYTHLGEDKDATSLENVKAAIQMMREANEIRAYHNELFGLSPENPTVHVKNDLGQLLYHNDGTPVIMNYLAPLDVSAYAMTISEVYANHAAVKFTHLTDVPLVDNLSKTFESPFNSWYYGEQNTWRSTFENFSPLLNESGQPYRAYTNAVGHFGQFIEPSHVNQGFGMTQNTVDSNFTTYSHGFEDGNEGFHSATWTVDEFENLFDTYYGLVQAKVNGTTPKTAEEIALENAQKTLDAYKDDLSAKTQAASAASTANDAAQSDKATKQSAMEAAAKALQDTIQANPLSGIDANEAKTELDAATAALKGAKDEAKACADAVTAADQTLVTATYANTAAAARLEAAEKASQDAHKAADDYAAATKDAPTPEEAQRLIAARDAAKAAYDDAKVAYDDAKAVADAAAETFAAATTRLNAATTNLTDAANALEGARDNAAKAKRAREEADAALDGAEAELGRAAANAESVRALAEALSDARDALAEATDVSHARVEGISGASYDGTAKVQPQARLVVTVSKDGRSEDYVLKQGVGALGVAATYASNVDAGTATVTLSAAGEPGSGAFWGSKSATYKIAPANVSAASVSAIGAQTYAGRALTPRPAVTFRGRALREGSDYALAYRDNVNAGTAIVTITGRGNWAGTRSVAFPISKAPSSVRLADQSKAYTGRAQAYSGAVTRAGSAGKVAYRYYGDPACKKELAAASVVGAGTYYVRATLAADANHDAATSAAARLVVTKAAPSISATDKTVAFGGVVALDAKSSGDGKLSYASSNAGVAKVDGSGRVTGASAGTATITLASAETANWRKATRTVTVRVVPASISGASVSGLGAQAYTGKALTPRPTVKVGATTLREGTDYALAYANNVNAGTATVTVTGKGNYAGSKSATFRIEAPEASQPAQPSAPASSRPSWQRLWGQGALDTAAAVVRAGGAFADGRGGTVVVATSDGYWDALAASGLAGTLDAPVVITAPGSLSPQAAAEIRRLRPARALVMGGPLAVSDACLAQVRSLVPDTRRVFGQAATDTAVEIYRAGSGWGRTAVVATSGGYWDALSVAPYAWAKRAPIFLTGADNRLGQPALAAIRAGGFTRVVIVGGALAVSPDVERQLSGIAVTRLWGQGALDTSAAIARWELSEGMSLQNMGVATADGYWDALAGAALCGKGNSVLVLVLGSDCRAFDAVYDRSKVRQGWVFGGEMAVSRAAWDHVTAR